MVVEPMKFDINVDVDLLPAVHGSSLFTRGETQSLGVITLGTDGDEQNSDAFGEQLESFYFHYNFPPFSVGECGFRLVESWGMVIGSGVLSLLFLRKKNFHTLSVWFLKFLNRMALPLWHLFVLEVFH